MLDPRQRSAPVWTIRSVAVRSRDGPQRVARVYRRLLAPLRPRSLRDFLAFELAPPRHDAAGWQRAVEQPAEPQARRRGEMT